MPERKLSKLNLPPLSVLVSCFAPWSLTARITTSAQGFPFTSRNVPLIDPVWPPARGASRDSSAATKIAASAPDFLKRFVLHSPFSPGSPTRSIRAKCALLSLIRARFQVSARQKRFDGKGLDPARRLPKMRASAAYSCRKRRKRYLRFGSTTRLDAVARPARCPAV